MEQHAALDALVMEVFGLDFGPWRALGYQFDEYTPFTHFEEGRAVANVSASPMQLTVCGRELTAVQVGTVCTLPSHRGRGLARELLERAHRHWEGRCAFSYLFADEAAIELYERAGYRRVEQHRFCCRAPAFGGSRRDGVRRLDLGKPDELAMTKRYSDERAAISQRLGVRAQAWIWLFHARLQHGDALVYIEPLDAIAVSAVEDGTLHIFDLVGPRVPTFEQVYPYLTDESVETVRFHFTPERLEVPDLQATPADDLPVFVRGAFPALDGPFVFPATAEA